MNHAIVMTFDDFYFEHAMVCINSLRVNYPNHPTILVYYDGNIQIVLDRLKVLDKIKLMPYDFLTSIDIDIEVVNLGLVNNSKVYFKYLLWTDCFEEYDNVLYLDADTLILKPLDHLFLQDDFYIISDNTQSHNHRLFYPEKRNDKKLLRYLREDCFSYPSNRDDMANAGVFMIPKKYRNEENLRDLISLTVRYNDYLMFADQSAISLWCHKNSIVIKNNFEFNYQPCFVRELLLDFDVSIVHLHGGSEGAGFLNSI